MKLNPHQGRNLKERLGMHMAAGRDLIPVILHLSRCRSLDEIIGVLRDSARELTCADGITVVLREQDNCFYAEENAIGPLWKGKRFPMTACVSGWCMLHREQVAIADIFADSRIPHDAYRPTFVKSLAMAPIRSADPVGAIGAYWASHHQATPEELGILQALGDSAAMALENSQLIAALKETSRRKDAFVSMLAHELRNPLSPLRNGLHLLRLQSQQPDAVEQTREMMDRQVVHLSRIVDELLELARINNGKVTLKQTRLDLTTLFRQCVEDHRPTIQAAGLVLETQVPLESVWIDADATRLTQVFHNVLDNARKYTPAGGTVSVSLSADPVSGQATIDVRDTGIGIAPELLPCIFETFVQADTSLDRTGGGLGLGLPVVHGLVKLHGGSIAATSEGIGKGTCFTITLPQVRCQQNASAVTPPAANGNKLRLLIIEDNKDAANSLQKILKICGYETAVAYDGCAGVDLARSQRPDVVLCDIGLPAMDGYEVAATLRQSTQTAHARLIAVTGYGSEDARERVRAAGFCAHLVKPIDIEQLLGHIRAVA